MKACQAHTGTELSVLFFQFNYTALQIYELCLPPVARVLCGDAVAVSTSLLAFIG